MNSSHISVSYIEDILPESFADFSALIHHRSLSYKCESRPRPGPYAGVEWLIPTVVVVFIGKAYFESFLKEAGKDHYHLLKAGLAKLADRFIGANAPATRLIFSDGKVKEDAPKYSLVYSIYAELEDGISTKLLLQENLSADQCNDALNSFLEFVEMAHEGNLDPSSVKGLAGVRLVGRILLLSYNPCLKQLEVVNPIPRKI